MLLCMVAAGRHMVHYLLFADMQYVCFSDDGRLSSVNPRGTCVLPFLRTGYGPFSWLEAFVITGMEGRGGGGYDWARTFRTSTMVLATLYVAL